MTSANFTSIAEAKLSGGTRVLARVDFNVPCSASGVQNDYRIKRVLPTLKLLEAAGCRTVLLSHLGSDAGDSLEPVAAYLAQHISISFAVSLEEAEKKALNLTNGSFLLVENIRKEKGETDNDSAFSQRLSKLGDVYVNDAFAVSHRKHASVVGVPALIPSYAGLLLVEELEHLRLALDPGPSSLFVLGGAKFETKLPLLMKFLTRYTRVFVGGALANDIFQSMGLEVGSSLVSSLAPDLRAITNQPNMRIPLDVAVEQNGAVSFIEPHAVKPFDRIVDLGPKSCELLEQFASESKFILWNGPLGVYQEGHTTGTQSFAKSISRSRAKSVVGGGDTVAAIEKLSLMEKFGFVSTGGGAMLDFLANETLPGIEALKR